MANKEEEISPKSPEEQYSILKDIVDKISNNIPYYRPWPWKAEFDGLFNAEGEPKPYADATYFLSTDFRGFHIELTQNCKSIESITYSAQVYEDTRQIVKLKETMHYSEAKETWLKFNRLQTLYHRILNDCKPIKWAPKK